MTPATRLVNSRRGRILTSRRLLCAAAVTALLVGCGSNAPSPSPVPTAPPSPTATPALLPPPGTPEMEVYRVRVEATSGAVLLKEKGGSRYLAMGIGLAEVTAIAVEIDQVQMPRPLTADLLISVIETLGAEVSHVVITSLRNNTFYAEIVMTVGGEKLVLDSRPSDAMALALRTNVPIYAEESLLAEAGIELGQLNGESLNGERDR